MNRTDVIQAIADTTGARSYLEVGVEDGHNFVPLRIRHKTGVDPQLGWKRQVKLTLKALGGGHLHSVGATYRKATSDDYFSSEDPNRGFDVVFIDGLHTYEQSLKDVINSLAHLNDGGLVVMHDCNPPCQASACAAASWQEALERHLPGPDRPWCGDVWKTVCHLRIARDDLRVFVLDCDFGIGIVTRGTPEGRLPLALADLDEMTYDDLVRDRDNLLNLKHETYLFEFLEVT